MSCLLSKIPTMDIGATHPRGRVYFMGRRYFLTDPDYPNEDQHVWNMGQWNHVCLTYDQNTSTIVEVRVSLIIQQT